MDELAGERLYTGNPAVKLRMAEHMPTVRWESISMVKLHEILSRQSRAFDTDLSNVEDVMPCQWRDFNPATIKHTCKAVGSDIIRLSA